MFSFFLVRDHSMAPSVLEGDVVFASSLFRPRPGDVAVIRDPELQERLLLKRVKRIEQECCWVEGDNKEQSRDSRQFGSIPLHSVIGRVWKISPGRGSLTGKFVV
ncbi:MAG: S26 family signal peptidase [bacterium]|nr:S26 family signal peptidase [bacterium]